MLECEHAVGDARPTLLFMKNSLLNLNKICSEMGPTSGPRLVTCLATHFEQVYPSSCWWKYFLKKSLSCNMIEHGVLYYCLKMILMLFIQLSEITMDHNTHNKITSDYNKFLQGKEREVLDEQWRNLNSKAYNSSQEARSPYQHVQDPLISQQS